jgi:hypothetical protein
MHDFQKYHLFALTQNSLVSRCRKTSEIFQYTQKPVTVYHGLYPVANDQGI